VSKGNQSGQPVRAEKRRGPHILSTLLFITAIAFAGLAVYLYWNEQEKDDNEPTPPPAVSGEYNLAQVKAALDEAGLSTDFGRNTVHANQIDQTVPGQTMKVNGNDVAVFIFSQNQSGIGPIEQAEAAYAEIDESTITLSRTSGDEVGANEPKHVFQGSNIILVMVGGSDEDVEEVRAAIEGLT